MTRRELRAQRQAAEQEVSALERELRETRCRLQRAYDAFDLVSDPDLIEAWIFEINAQRAKYAYLLKQRKALEQEQTREDGVRT